MADWLKVRHALVRSQKVYRLAREMHTQRYTALGVALTWLVWLDEQTEDGQTGLSAEEVDDMLGFRGAAAALVRIGWASIGGDGTLVAEEFGKHCGASAKERAETARRVARCRARKGEARSERYFCNGDRNGDGVTDVTDDALSDALPEEKRIYMNHKGDSKAEVCSAREPQPAPPLDGFGEWLAALAAAHPSLAKSRVLARDVEAEARDAFSRCPQAADQAELLKAYLADTMQEDHHHVRFYRPVGQSRFFADLEDVLAHAERWDRETGWSRRRRRRSTSVPIPAQQVPEGASEEEQEEFLRELHDLKGGAR